MSQTVTTNGNAEGPKGVHVTQPPINAPSTVNSTPTAPVRTNLGTPGRGHWIVFANPA